MSASPAVTPQRSGVYRSPPNAATLVAGAGEGLSVDLSGVRSKAALLGTVAAAFALGPDFGANWDALADSLQDVPLISHGRVLHLAHAAPASAALGNDWVTFLEILEDAAMYWKERDRAFVVLVDDASQLPAWT